MPKHKNSDILRKLQDVSQLIQQNKSDAEIMALLKLPQRTLTRYKQRICEQNKQIWAKLIENQLEGELIKLKDSLESTYRIALTMSQDPECKDRIDWLNTMNDSRLNIVKQLVEYPDFVRPLEESSTSTSNIPTTLKRVHS